MVNIVFANKQQPDPVYTYNELVQKMVVLGMYTAICPFFSDKKPVLLVKIPTGPNKVAAIFTLTDSGEYLKLVDQSLVFTDIKPVALKHMEVVTVS